MTEVLLLIVAVLLILACALFVAAEFSLTTVDRVALEQAAEAGERGAVGALKAVRRLTVQLSGAQLGITVTSLVIGMLAQPSLAKLLAGPLESAGLAEGTANGVALVLGIALSSVALMVFGELVPKNWAISRPVPVAKVVATPQRAFTRAFSPLIIHLNSTANRAVRRMGLEPVEELASARSPRELVALARHSVRAGTLEPDTADLFVRAVSLGDLTAEQIMTPRVRIHGLRAEDPVDEVIAAARATGHSRFPVYRDTLDAVDGAVDLKAALAVPEADRGTRTVAEIAAEPVLVPETLPVDDLLDRLRGEWTMAVVIDEYGGTAGVVTLEDIVEEVVGAVRDEHDREEVPEVVAVDSGDPALRVWDIDGGYRLDQLERLGPHAPEGPYETVAGLIAERLSRIPEAGDSVVLDDWTLTVTEVARHRAARVRVVGPPPAAPDDAHDAHDDETRDDDGHGPRDGA
ncbi:hemolysin family protein [Yinghuangia sp. ASG 101]|uniref:hemolysin family protein n=1 Tax=Yinghuangia sp. ASG 101 TaxID=2896848 RepID=UPI001E65089D|nr:hemolysin family protein [Yinghuangia sp. ASG 101]UGQ09063.1 hemolysin family protein [Yinghuangia sp. ASG 101]